MLDFLLCNNRGFEDMTSNLLSSSEILWFRLTIVPMTCTPTVLRYSPSQHSFYTVFAIAFQIHLLFRQLWKWTISIVSWSWYIHSKSYVIFGIKVICKWHCLLRHFGKLQMYPFVYFFSTVNCIQTTLLFLTILISTVSSKSCWAIS